MFADRFFSEVFLLLSKCAAPSVLLKVFYNGICCVNLSKWVFSRQTIIADYWLDDALFLFCLNRV